MSIRLDQLPKGLACSISSIDDSHAHASQLRRIGFSEGVVVERLNNHCPALIRCGNTKVAVTAAALAGIKVHAPRPSQSPATAFPQLCQILDARQA